MQNKEFAIAVVGGGIVGLAAAYQIQCQFPELNIVVFEKEKELASHQLLLRVLRMPLSCRIRS